MKSLENLWRVMAKDLAIRCRTSTTLDYKTVKRRSKDEGLSFLTITLPKFCKDFERCLEQGTVDSSAFHGFHKRQGPLPCFLEGFLSQVFDRKTGMLLQEPCIDSIFAIRQLTSAFAKILLPCSDARNRDAIQQFLQCEKEVADSDRNTPLGARLEFREVARTVFRDVFTQLEKEIENFALLPKHGPGATADRLKGNLKFDQTEWTQRLERVFPFGEYAIANWRYYYQLDRVHFLEPSEERPVKVTLVPKTLKTPRVIAIEPTCMQYMQGALGQRLVELLETDRTLNGTVGGHKIGLLGFTDQKPNRRMACEGSYSNSLGTLDLSEASDRVSIQHVRDLLSDFPLLQEGVFASRSSKAVVPSGDVYTLRKFASMGSALCFPVEAMVFLTIIVLAISKELSIPVTKKSVRALIGRVRVYGDDIIVPTHCVRSVIEYLELFGFKVNSSKSFWNGKFRESCGGDYYDGVDVRPVKIRRVFPAQLTDAQEVISLVSLRNQLYFAGMWMTARYLDGIVGSLLPHYPAVLPESPALGRHSFLGYDTERTCRELHRPLVRGYVVSSKPPKSISSGEGALLKCLLKQGHEPFADSKHLERQGRPRTVGIKPRWITPY